MQLGRCRVSVGKWHQDAEREVLPEGLLLKSEERKEKGVKRSEKCVES